MSNEKLTKKEVENIFENVNKYAVYYDNFDDEHIEFMQVFGVSFEVVDKSEKYVDYGEKDVCFIVKVNQLGRSTFVRFLGDYGSWSGLALGNPEIVEQKEKTIMVWEKIDE